MRSKYFILLLIFLSACMPQSGSKITPSTETATPVETFTPSPVPTSTPILPEKDISSYKFKPLNKETYQYIFGAIGYEIDDQRFDVYYRDIPNYLLTLQSEYLLKFPESENQEDIKWSIAIRSATEDYSKTHIGDGLIEEYLLEIFSRNLSVEEIDEELQSHNIFLMNSFEAKNLIGKGENGIVFTVRLPDENGSVATFFIHSYGGDYQIEKITNWERSYFVAMGQYFDDVSYVGDTNKNGIDEIVIEVEVGHSGIPQTWGQTLRHIEWSDEEDKFVSFNYPISFQECGEFGSGPCQGEWEFSNVNSNFVLTTIGYLYTRSTCPNLVFQRISVWNGENYDLGSLDVMPPDETYTSECLLAWTETVSAVNTLDGVFRENEVFDWGSDDVIYYAEKSLENWSFEMDEIWGPASKDYVRLQLGIWYDQRGEYGEALNILTEVATLPYSPEHDFISRMANLYLKVRDDSNITQACIQVNNAFTEDFLAKIPQPTSAYELDADYLKIWGVIAWKGNLCDERGTFRYQVENLISDDFSSFENWLNESKYKVKQNIIKDFDGDSKLDSLILMEMGRYVELWLIRLTSDGLKAHDLNFYLREDINQIKILNLSDTTEQQVFLLSADDWLRIVRIFPDGRTEILLEKYDGVKSFGVSTIRDSVRIVVNIDSSFEGRKINVYEWNMIEEAFVLMPNTFEVFGKGIEKDFFVEYKYLQVANSIEEFLLTPIDEPIEWYSCNNDSGCVYSPPFYIPYFRYLQGLSYEQLGDFNKARDVYYELWNDYPDNVFGVVASMKLELVR